MAVDALQLLPPANDQSVFRGDWSSGSLDGWVPNRGLYSGDTFTFDSLSSTSRNQAAAEGFAKQ